MIVCPVIGSKQIVRSDPQITLGTPYWWFWPHSAPPCLFFCPSRGNSRTTDAALANFLVQPLPPIIPNTQAPRCPLRRTTQDGEERSTRISLCFRTTYGNALLTLE